MRPLVNILPVLSACSPILSCHTLPPGATDGSGKSWQAFMDEYEVATFDLRGYGESEIPKVRCGSCFRTQDLDCSQPVA